jgi:hypothetical protein
MVELHLHSPYVFVNFTVSRDSSVGTEIGCRLDDWVRLLVRTRDFCLLQRVYSGSGAHQASYTEGTGDSFLEGKAAGAGSSIN